MNCDDALHFFKCLRRGIRLSLEFRQVACGGGRVGDVEGSLERLHDFFLVFLCKSEWSAVLNFIVCFPRSITGPMFAKYQKADGCAVREDGAYPSEPTIWPCDVFVTCRENFAGQCQVITKWTDRSTAFS